MRDDQSFNVDFVGIVEKYRALYNYREKDYSKRHVTEKLWAGVAKEVKKQLKEECTGEDCKNRWRVLRSSFVRFTNQKNGEGGAERRPYYLFEAMQFLQPFTRSRVSASLPCNFVDCSLGTPEEESMNGSEETYFVESVGSKEEFQRQIFKQETSSARNKDEPNKRKMKTNEMEEPESPQSYTEKKRCVSSHESADFLFLRSILPDIKNFSVQQKLKFKRGVLDLISEIHDEGVASTAHADSYAPALSAGDYEYEDASPSHAEGF